MRINRNFVRIRPEKPPENMSSSEQAQSPFSTQKGTPFPLGTTEVEDGFNFALFSDNATSVFLQLYPSGSNQPTTFKLEKSPTEIGSVWHLWVSGIEDCTEYLYQVDGPNDPDKGLLFTPENLLVDPYAKSFNSPQKWGHTLKTSDLPLKGEILRKKPFDWQGAQPPNTQKEDLVIYEMHTRGFTQDSSSDVEKKGSFLGIIEKIPYLKSLGINAIELMPIFEFDENGNPRKNPSNDVKLFNYWGYTSANFFTPMKRYAFSDEKGAVIEEFKTLVREMHKNGIEVILDVVYNHVLSARVQNPYPCFHGIDNTSYYLLSEHGHHMNFSGCGNTLKCNHPAMKKLIIDSLIYWVQEMHVDGFRFDLASILTRSETGEPLDPSPIIQEIVKAPELSNTKLIVEAWDAAGLYQVGTFPKWGNFSEWNGQYRDALRRFLKGDANQAANFASAITGSSNLYEAYHSTNCSINFVTAHDGYTLHDLVSYEQKHNLENGENNQDGCNNNDSWNCGEEGPATDQTILQLRERQIQNFFFALFISRGIPMILMGDEYGHTRNGNNNTWCLDSEKNWFLWDQLEKNEERFHFVAALIHFRKNNPIFRKKEFYTEKEIDWHGLVPFETNWSEDRRYLALTIKGEERSFYIAFNASHKPLTFQVPPTPNSGKEWTRVIDTSVAYPENFIQDPTGRLAIKDQYEIPSYSSILLETK